MPLPAVVTRMANIPNTLRSWVRMDGCMGPHRKAVSTTTTVPPTSRPPRPERQKPGLAVERIVKRQVLYPADIHLTLYCNNTCGKKICLPGVLALSRHSFTFLA